MYDVCMYAFMHIVSATQSIIAAWTSSRAVLIMLWPYLCHAMLFVSCPRPMMFRSGVLQSLWTTVHAGHVMLSGQTFPQTVNLPADMPSGPVTIRWLWAAWNLKGQRSFPKELGNLQEELNAVQIRMPNSLSRSEQYCARGLFLAVCWGWLGLCRVSGGKQMISGV